MTTYKITRAFASSDYSLEEIVQSLDRISIDDEDSMTVVLTFKAGETITLDLGEND